MKLQLDEDTIGAVAAEVVKRLAPLLPTQPKVPGGRMTADDEKRFRLIIREEVRAVIQEGALNQGSILTQQEIARFAAVGQQKMAEKIARRAAREPK